MSTTLRYRCQVKRAAGIFGVVILLLFCAIAAGNAANPIGTARFALRASAMWRDFWPFSRGKLAPVRLIHLSSHVGLFKPVQIEVQPGFLMELDPRDLVTGSILLDGIWEPRITGITMALLREGSVFLDVGAHVGYYSLLASTQVGPSGRVISIEPNPATAQRLRRNILLNKVTNVSVEEVACTDKEQTLEFSPAAVYNTGMSSISAKNANSTNRIIVRGVPLDLIVKARNLQGIDLIKIDVEGAELQVLRGMQEAVAKYRPTIVAELKPELLANMGASMNEVASWFHQAGYLPARKVDEEDYLWTPDPSLQRSNCHVK